MGHSVVHPALGLSVKGCSMSRILISAKTLRPWLAGASTAVVLVGCGGGSGDGEVPTQQTTPPVACTASPNAVVSSETYVPVRAAALFALQSTKPMPRRVASPRTLSLPALVETRSAQVLPNGVRQIGVARSVAPTQTVKATTSVLQWQPADGGGTVAALRFQSAEARGIRLGLLVEALPAGATLRVYAQNSSAAAEVAGSTVLATLQRNQDAGETGSAAHTYWMPGVDSDEVTLEVLLPAGTAPADVRVAVPSLSHLVESVRADEGANLLKVGESGACQVDVTCSATYSAESNAVAKMVFVDAGRSYLCTGTLMNDATSSGTPYFLSANHCIASQTVASTLTTHWFYRASACNSNTLSPQARVLNGGATLLYASALTDTAFMRLNAAPPAGVAYAGWSASLPTVGGAAAGVHQPRGDLQKLSQGALQGFQRCTPTASGDYACQSAAADAAQHVAVGWTSGATEAGSSGSGLFQTRNGGRYLVGQLTGGTSSCTMGTGVDYYGRFDVAYAAALGQWLGATPATGTCPATAVAVRTPG